MDYEKWYKIHDKKVYQFDVIETIYDKHNCLLWSAYDETIEDDQGFNDMLIILDRPNKERIILKDSEANRQHCMKVIDNYLMDEYF